MQLSKYVIYNDLYNLICVSNDYYGKYIKYVNEYIKNRDKYVKYTLLYVIERSIKYVYLHPVKLNLIYKPFSININQDEDGFEYIKIFDWNTIIFKQSEIEVYSTHTGQSSTIGGCGDLKIPVEDFTYSIKNEKGITIKDITECVYRLKGSKYDFWYESLLDIEIKKISKNKIKCHARFNY